MHISAILLGLIAVSGIATAATTTSLQPHSTNTSYGTLYYETEGSGEPLILVAGGPGASRVSFQPWFARLSGHHQVVYYDAIGRGRSDRLLDPQGYTVARDVDDIEALRKTLGADKIALLGQSYGGIPALAYAIKYPEHVTHLVLSSAMTSAASFQANIDATNATMKTYYPDAWSRVQALRHQGLLSTDERSEVEYARMGEMMYWHDGQWAGQLTRSANPAEKLDTTVYRAMVGEDPDHVVGGTLKDYDPWPQVGRLAAKTLVIGGRYDRVTTPEITYQTYQALPPKLAQLEMFEHSGHRPWVEEGDAYFARVAAFLGDESQSLAQMVTTASLVGTWRLVMVDNLMPDGTRVKLYGDHPEGRLIFDPHGRYILQMVNSQRKPFASADRANASAAEYKDSVLGNNAHFGRYSLDSRQYMIEFRIEHASFPNWDGSTQRRRFELAGNRLKYIVPAPTTGNGAVGEVEWEREGGR